jgi:hypothetical protein
MDKTQIYASIIAVVGVIASIIILFFALSIQNAVSNFSKNAREYINNYENLKAEMTRGRNRISREYFSVYIKGDSR